MPNFPGKLFCEKCGAPFLLDYAQGRWVKSSTVRRAVVLWIAAIAALVGIPSAAVALPPAFAAAVVVVLLLLGVTLLVRGFRDSSMGAK
jgi:hypothetical protein